MSRTHDEDGQPMMSNRAMLQMLVKEIPVMYRDLRDEIRSLDQRLSRKIDSVSSDLKGLRLQVHQNQSSLIQTQEDLEKRVAVLETAA